MRNDWKTQKHHYLTILTNRLAHKYFHESFSPHIVVWDRHMSTSAGMVTTWYRYNKKTNKVERHLVMKISTKYFLHNNYHGLVDTVKHELIHYTLWKEHRPFGHNKRFHQIARKIGCGIHCPPPEEWIKPMHHFQYIYKYDDGTKPIYTNQYLPMRDLVYNQDNNGNVPKLVYVKDKQKYQEDIKNMKIVLKYEKEHSN